MSRTRILESPLNKINMKSKITFFLIILSLLLSACNSKPENVRQVDSLPSIFPDYIGVTIPVEIAPMNFNLLSDDNVDCVDVTVKGSRCGEIHSNGEWAEFDIDEWHELVCQNKGGTLSFTVCAKINGQWLQYKDFDMYVSQHPLEEWGLTYRRIAPGYEVYSQMGLYQRDISSFEEYEIISNTRVPGNCVNCHTSNRTEPDQILFHVRGNNGATVVRNHEKIDNLNTKTDETLGACVYPYWHPDGKYIVFSTNTTRQSFHVAGEKRIEVFDEASDLQVYDVEQHQLILSPLTMQKGSNESFPAFSPDGKTIYFCTATKRDNINETCDIRYDLCSIGFDAATGRCGNKVDTLVIASRDSMSISIPKPSYDGRWLMYTLADYGTFPIWHKEADLWLLDLTTNQAHPLIEANSPDTESYHNWSQNSQWFVFSSRRDGGGLYTRLYLSSIDKNGSATKPFLLPQRNPLRYYDRLLHSYNVPDFTKSKVDVDYRQFADGINSNERINLTVLH